jgi:hypothetical protein
MSRIPKYAAKRDANEAEIVEALRGIPGTKVILRSVKGEPDLDVGYKETNYKLEVKSAKGKLTAAEQEFFDTWPGQCAVVRSVDEALRVIGAID